MLKATSGEKSSGVFRWLQKLWQSRVLPALMRDLANEDFAPYAIYPLSYMIEHSDKLDYAEIYRPSLEHVFHQVDKSPQTQVILLRNLSTFAKFAPPDEILRLLVPLLENALESHNPEILVSPNSHMITTTVFVIVIGKKIRWSFLFCVDRKLVCFVSASFTQ